MAYNSSLLAADVTSSYLYFDNLRNDITAGKFWDASDGTETKYIQLSHNATNGIIQTSSGDILMKPAGGDTLFYDTGGTKTLGITHDGTDSVLTGSSGGILVKAATGITKFYDSTAAKTLSIQPSTTLVIFSASGTGFSFRPTTNVGIEVYDNVVTNRIRVFNNGTDGVIDTNAGDIILDPSTHIIQIGKDADTSQTKIKLYDTTLGAYKTAVINNGAWVIS